MGWYGDSVHDNPAAFGLTLIADMDSGGGYEYNQSAVWRRDDDGRFLYGNSSGCSCSVPWEGFTSQSDLTPVTSLLSLHRALAADHPSGYGAAGQICDMLERCAAAGLR